MCTPAYGHTDVLLNQPAIAPLGQAAQHGDLPRLAARMGFTDACFADSDEALARDASGPSGSTSRPCTREGWASWPLPDAPFAGGGFATASGKALVDAPGWGCPITCPTTRARFDTRTGEALPAGDDLATGAPLPQLQLRQRGEPARHRGRAAAGDPPATRAARGIASGAMVRVFNDRGGYHCKAEVSARARPGVVNGLGVWWRKFGLAGTNVNELTHQRLTDMGRCADLLRLPGRGRRRAA